MHRMTPVASLSMLCLLWHGIVFAQPPADFIITSPQVVAGPGFATSFTLSNLLADENCRVDVTYHLGAGNGPAFPILTNGQDQGNSFTMEIPGVPVFLTGTVGAGFTRLDLTTGGDFFVGAATFSIEPACGSLVSVQTEYRFSETGFESFSHLPEQVGTLRAAGDCVAFPWSYAPGASDTGIALVSEGNTNVPIDIEARNGLDSLRTVFDFNGTHRARLISEDLDAGALAELGGGAFVACATAEPAAPIYVLVLGVLTQQSAQPQAGSGTNVQLQAIGAPETTEKCRSNKQILCLDFEGRKVGRYQIFLVDGFSELPLRDDIVTVSRSKTVNAFHFPNLPTLSVEVRLEGDSVELTVLGLPNELGEARAILSQLAVLVRIRDACNPKAPPITLSVEDISLEVEFIGEGVVGAKISKLIRNIPQ